MYLFRTDAEAVTGQSAPIPERSAIAPEDQWDVAALYPDAAAWEADFQALESRVTPLEALRGRLDSPEQVARFFALETELDRLVHKVYVYAHLRADEDTADNAGQARMSRIQARTSEISGRLAWALPEILAHDADTLQAWCDSEALRADRFALVKILRRKPHTLSEPEETLLSRAREVFSAPGQTYSFLTNADLRFPRVADSRGTERELSNGRYITLLLDGDRTLRKNAFDAMYDTYGNFRNTLCSTLTAAVKAHNFNASTRHFPSALEASLHPDHVPSSLYDSLLSATHAALPQMHGYVALRQRRLALPDLGMHDMYVAIVPECEISIPFEQAREWILAACAPLGEEYLEALRSAFTERWVDKYENRGKRSGAYSSGCYDSLPYILMNYQGTLDSVFTLAHELGHSLHSWLSRKYQPPRTADYPIFVAEIPSTLNEGLLLDHLLRTTEDPRFRAHLLNHLCDAFRGTVYRQTMFAEFERILHESDAAGQPLTPDFLDERYFALNAEYYGAAVTYDRRIGREWSRIPHFYYNYYLYKYATSFCASRIFLRNILSGEAGRDAYLDMLRAGGSDDPLALIGRAGVDLTDPAVLHQAFEQFAQTIQSLDEALGAGGRA